MVDSCAKKHGPLGNTIESAYFRAEKHASDTASPSSSGSAVSAVGSCFDCNICLDITIDPVVTLCGHLYYYPVSISGVAVEFSGSRAEALQFQIKSKMTLVAGVLPGDDDDDRWMASKREAQLGMYGDCSFTLLTVEICDSSAVNHNA
ncbi:E3 ubiquitin-protein ligase RMA3 [Apostasia shenzhenica]|uniref:E3 ubiquitin-protein ligase RMA n=1 Tax=Apostasia shenzhenica TaxID=1088818 RepID=A0A2H9ZYJ7_9ASPA|nr:E3 ubiquitin-protein ligase RMA3 [Apostasia shenzhenica]